MRFAVIFLFCCAMVFAFPRNAVGQIDDRTTTIDLITAMMEELQDEGKTHYVYWQFFRPP